MSFRYYTSTEQVDLQWHLDKERGAVQLEKIAHTPAPSRAADLTDSWR